MRKVKIMLTAVVVLGAVGGALAFKSAKRFTGTLYCTTPAGTCPTAIRYTPNTGASSFQSYCRLTEGSGQCNSLTDVIVHP